MSSSADQPWWWPVHQVARAIRTREISAVEYLEIVRTRAVADTNNLVVTYNDRARADAEAADLAVTRGEPLGPLHGVAMTVKDTLATRGIRSTAGMAERRTHVPRADAAVVAALRDAGAVIYGKTNTPDGAADVQTRSSVFGTSTNPWHPGYSTGGSSGGGAGAVAAGLAPAEVGSDVAGSIRLPAAMCGVAGHKPSFGTVPVDGHLSYADPLVAADMAVVGPLARSVADLAVMLDVMCGPSPWDRTAWRVTLPPARLLRRVAVWFDDPYCPVDSEARTALEVVAARLTGVRVEPAVPRGVGLADSDDVFQRMLAGAAAPEPPDGGLGTRHLGQSLRDWLAAGVRQAHLRERWRLFFTRYDAILLPVAPNLAIEHDHRPVADRRITVNGTERPYWDQIVWAGLASVSHLPSTVVPVCLDSRGLPIGVAVVGPYLEDRTCLALAREIAAVTGPLGHPPMAVPT